MIDSFLDTAQLVEFPDSQQSVAGQLMIESKQGGIAYKSLVQLSDRNTANLLWFGRTDSLGTLRVVLPFYYTAVKELLVVAMDDTGTYNAVVADNVQAELMP